MTIDKDDIQDDSSVKEAGGGDNKLPDKNRLNSFLIVTVTLAVSVIAVILAGYNYRSIISLKSNTTVTDRVEAFESSLAGLDRAVASLQRQQQEIEAAQKRLTDTLARTSQSLQSLYDRQNSGDNHWPLAEIEHLINIANLRITLEQDTETALAALQLADDRLADLGDPGLFPVRRQLAAEMNALSSVTPVDITGISLYLTDMVTRVETLPLKENAVTDGTAATDTLDASLPAWKRLLINVWQEFKGMFTITRTGDNAGATLLPDEKYFLYQNLRLQLEAARLAVLRRDTSSLHESLNVVRSWLEEYFDLRDTSVMNIIQATEKMRSLELSPVLPEVGTSLEALRDYMDNSGATDQEAESNIQ